MGKFRGKLRSLLHNVQDSLGLSPLEKWYIKWNEDIGPRVAALYLFSPEYEELMGQAWREYDDLEAARVRDSRPPLDWQSEFQQQREATRQLWDFRKVIYSPMSAEKMSAAPLQAYLHHKLDTPMEARLEDRMFSWRATLDNWANFQHQAAARPSFLEGLSSAQRTAFQLLKEWWNSSYADPALLEAARDYMESRREVEYHVSPFNDDEVIRETRLDASLYHTDCFYLFCHEFHPRVWEPFTSHRCIMSLSYKRQQASWLAISQRFAHSIAKCSQGRLPAGTPYIPPARLDNKWFERVDREDQDYPFYLWDAVQKRTIEVGEVCPEYICISHTWGRWRIPGQAAQLPGVPWPVPENTLYDVRDLPDMLERLGERYIWFDLFCIPQIRGDPRAQREISHQAAIFRHSKRCIAWLHQCPSFDGVLDALRWLAFRFLKMTTREGNPLDDIDRTFDALTRAASNPIELIHVVVSPLDVQTDPWFTSLWTLQETVLCPEIELCSRDWQKFQVNEEDPLTLTTMAVFISTAYQYCERAVDIPFSQRERYGKEAFPATIEGRGGWDEIQQYPPGVRDLMLVVFLTQLDQVLVDLSPMRVLATLGKRRYKDADRAPAIMSAIGVTDWYNEGLENSPNGFTDTMLFGNFSLSFVREAARKIGSQFFTGSPYSLRLTGSAEKGPGGFLSGEGTMLPISQISAGSSVGNVAGVLPAQGFLAPHDHPSLAEWTIRSDASVEMKKVGITSFSGSQIAVECEMFGMNYAYNELGGSIKVKDVDIRSPTDFARHLSKRSEGATLYAVALSQSEQNQTGILLAHLPGQDDSSRIRLVKIGDYDLVGVPEPPSTAVDWLVL